MGTNSEFVFADNGKPVQIGTLGPDPSDLFIGLFYSVDEVHGYSRSDVSETTSISFGTGYRYPAIHDGVLYFAYSDGLRWFSADDGSKLGEHYQQYAGGGMSPAYKNGVVYFGSGELTAYDVENDERLWASSNWYSSSQPAVVNGTIYACNSGGIAINTADGSEKWFTSASGGTHTPTVYDGTVVYTDNGNFVRGYNTSDGTEQWSASTGSSPEGHSMSSDGIVYVGDYGDNARAIDATDGTELWNYTQSSGGISMNPSIGPDKVAFGDSSGVVHGINRSDGSQAWTANVGTDFNFVSFAYHDGVHYAGTYDGASSRVYAIDTADGSVLAQSADAGDNLCGGFAAEVIDFAHNKRPGRYSDPA